MKPGTLDLQFAELEFTADRAAGVTLGGRRIVVDPDRPLFLANKANKSDQTRMRQGSPEWQRIQDFERAIRAAALAAVDAWAKCNESPWRIDASSYVVAIQLKFGDRKLVIPATPGRSRHTRRQTAKARTKSHDIDGVKSILDALQGVLFANDNQVAALHVIKSARLGGVEGDAIQIRCVCLTEAPVLEEGGRQTDRRAKRGASRAAESTASRPSPRSERST